VPEETRNQHETGSRQLPILPAVCCLPPAFLRILGSFPQFETQNLMASSKRVVLLKWYLRCIGTIDCLAVLIAIFPRHWIETMHGHLGLGSFPPDAITGYLARSASIMYALHGLCVLYVSTDIVRYLGLIRFLAYVALVHGGLLVWVDTVEGMPTWWVASEGPLFACSGLVALVLVGRNKPGVFMA
jgi:hypothetical protein